MEERGEQRARAFACLRHAFHNAVDRFGPNDFFVMQKCMKEVRRWMVLWMWMVGTERGVEGAHT